MPDNPDPYFKSSDLLWLLWNAWFQSGIIGENITCAGRRQLTRFFIACQDQLNQSVTLLCWLLWSSPDFLPQSSQSAFSLVSDKRLAVVPIIVISLYSIKPWERERIECTIACSTLVGPDWPPFTDDNYRVYLRLLAWSENIPIIDGRRERKLRGMEIWPASFRGLIKGPSLNKNILVRLFMHDQYTVH